MQNAQLPRPVGFVFGGGGSRGAIQVGMLQALAEHDVTPDLVAGTSVGAINGAVVAFDPVSATNRLAHAWAHVTREDVFPGKLIAQFEMLRRTQTHLFPNTGLAALIARFLGNTTTFSDLALPFAAVAMDAAAGAPYVVREGLLLPALLASAAIPGLYPLVEHDDHVLYDGGVIDNVPMRQAREMGAHSLVVLDCNFPGQAPVVPQSIAEVLAYVLTIASREQAVLDAPALAREIPVVYLPGPSWQAVSPLDFTHTEALIEAAYESARAFLQQLDVRGPELYGSP